MKRLLAALLTLSMLVGIVPFSAFAESPGAVPETFAAAQESPGLDDETVQSIVSDPLLQGQYAPPQQTQPTVDTSNISMEATDSFGKLLVNSIDEQNSASSSENRVIGVTVDGSTATVEYVAAEDADIVVALYTDDSEELMSASGTAPAFVTEDNTGSSTATVSLTGSIPNSFVVKAFLLDTVEHAPLSNEFTSNAYTKDMQDLKNATVDDYPADRVVNLDENDDTNFAVVKDDVVLVNEDDTSTGAMSVIDNDDGSCTIYNADEKTRNMQPGEIFVYQCEEGILVVQVETIDVSGSTVVISGDDALDLVDVFDIVKIEVADDGSQLEYDGTGVDEEVEYRGKVKEDSSLEETNALDDVDLSTSIAMKFVIGSDTFYDGEKTDIKDDTHVTSKFGVNAVLNLKLKTTFTYYVCFSSHNFTFSTDSEITGGVEISYAEDIKIDLGYFKKEFPGVYINYTPQFVFKGNVTGTFNYKLTSKQGITCENRQFHDISEEPVTEFSIKITGTVYIGLEFAPSIKIGVYKLFKPRTEENFNALASLTLTLAAGIEGTITADIQPETAPPNQIISTYHGNSVHECKDCISGTLHGKIKITIDVKIIKIWSTTATPVDITGHDFSIYYSNDFNDFGTGKCPHKLYLVNISIGTDTLPDNTEVFMSTKDIEKQSIGTLVGTTNNYCYMEPGTYTLKSWANGFFFSSEFTLTTSDTDVTLLASADGNFSGGGGDSGGGGGGGIIGDGESSGTCGENLTWKFDEDGTLTINGTGAMEDYTTALDTPWKSLNVKKVIIEEGVQYVGAWSFTYINTIESIELPNSLTSMGMAAFCGTGIESIELPDRIKELNGTFSNCEKLKQIKWPSELKTIGQHAFNNCISLTSIKIPNSVTSIKAYAFSKCNGLTEFTVPENVTELTGSVFWNCESLKKVTLAAKDTEIENFMFEGCTSLETVVIPSNIRTICFAAFRDCTELKDIYYQGTTAMWNNVEIDNQYDSNSPLLAATVHCTDGDILPTSTVSSEENSIFPSTATGDDHSFAASFSDLTPGVSYAVIVSRSEIDLLAPENLIYINQFRASSSDYQQSFQTKRSSTVTENDMFYVVAAGSRVFEDTSVNPGGGSSSGGGGGGGGGAAVLIGVGAAAAITAGVIMMSPVDVKGRVVLADQAAVPGAKISLLREGKVMAQTTADENGSFSLKAKRGSYELTAAYTTADGQLIYKTIDIKAPAKDLTVTF